MSFLNNTYQPPRWVLFVRLAQALVSTIVLVLTAYTFASITQQNTVAATLVSQLVPGLPFSFFAFAWTIAYLIFAIFFARQLSATAKPILIVLVLDCLTAIFWLVTFALLADSSASGILPQGYYEFGLYSTTYVSPAGNPMVCGQAAAGLGALVFILFIASIVGVALLAHRTRGTAIVPASASSGGLEVAKEAQPSVQQVSPNEQVLVTYQAQTADQSYSADQVNIHQQQQQQAPVPEMYSPDQTTYRA